MLPDVDTLKINKKLKNEFTTKKHKKFFFGHKTYKSLKFEKSINVFYLFICACN